MLRVETISSVSTRRMPRRTFKFFFGVKVPIENNVIKKKQAKSYLLHFMSGVKPKMCVQSASYPSSLCWNTGRVETHAHTC